MKHIILGHCWDFRTQPDRGYYRLKNDQLCIQEGLLLFARDLSPVNTFRITAPVQGNMLYYGNSYDEADKIKKEFDSWQANASHFAQLDNLCDTLLQNHFRLVRSRPRGIFVDRGCDNTQRCLLFFSAGSGHNGGVEVDVVHTSCTVLKQLHSASSVRSAVYVAALLDLEEWICYHAWEKGTQSHDYVILKWNGSVIEKEVIDSQLWKNSRKYEFETDPESQLMVL